MSQLEEIQDMLVFVEYVCVSVFISLPEVEIELGINALKKFFSRSSYCSFLFMCQINFLNCYEFPNILAVL